MAEKKKVILKWQISGGYYQHAAKEGESSVHREYPEPRKEVNLDAAGADSLVASGNAWTPSQWAKVRNKRG